MRVERVVKYKVPGWAFTFNSLFEMHGAVGRLRCHVRCQLSILYLRCSGYFFASIMSFKPAPFNSLFEMPCPRDAGHEGCTAGAFNSLFEMPPFPYGRALLVLNFFQFSI